MGFEAQNRIHLVGRVANVETLLSGKTIGNPEQPVQAHDVVDSKKLGEAKVITDVSDRIPISVGAHCFRMRWLKRPVLSRCENRIRWRSSAHSFDKELGISPGIEAVLMKAQGKVEIEKTSRRLAVVREFAKLALNKELSVEVVALSRLPARIVGARPKAHVLLELRILPEKTLEVFKSRSACVSEKGVRQHLEHAAFRPHYFAVVDEFRCAGPGLHQTLRLCGRCKLRSPSRIDVELIPEKAAYR